jgi:dTDP-4-amino-4,6-dideoxygalactose transaminase
MIPLFKVHMPEAVMGPLREVLLSGYIGQGKKVDEFEAALVKRVGNPRCLTLNNGTSGLHLALRLSGVGPGKNVVTTPMTCTATNEPILANGADIKWADINPMTGEIDPDDVVRKVDAKTAAIICVHWGGYPCDLASLNVIAFKYGIPLIEDAAHAFGASYRGKPIGSVSDFTMFSFQAIKHLTTVDGGLLTCRMDDDYRRGKLLRWYGICREGRSGFRCEPDIKEYGYKFHMNDVCATIGIVQLSYVDGILARHRDNARYYDMELADVFGVEPLAYDKERMSAYWLYTILVDGGVKEFEEFMGGKGVQVSPVHKRNDVHTMMVRFRDDHLPGVDEFERRQVSIPVGWWVTDEDRKTIADAIKEWSVRLGKK